jgi:hypothetical protein
MAVVPFGTSLYSQYQGKEGGDEILLVGQSLVEAGLDIKFTDLFKLARAVDRDDEGRETLKDNLTPAQLKGVTFALWNFIRSITKVVLTSEDLLELQELCVLPPFFNEQKLCIREVFPWCISECKFEIMMRQRGTDCLSIMCWDGSAVIVPSF